MEYWILFGSFSFLLLIGTPVAFCLGAASFFTGSTRSLPRDHLREDGRGLVDVRVGGGPAQRQAKGGARRSRQTAK